MNSLRRLAVRNRLAGLRDKYDHGSQEYQAINYVLSNTHAWVQFEQDLCAEQSFQAFGRESDMMWIEKVKEFFREWGPTILKICLVIATTMLGSQLVPTAPVIVTEPKDE